MLPYTIRFFDLYFFHVLNHYTEWTFWRNFFNVHFFILLVTYFRWITVYNISSKECEWESCVCVDFFFFDILNLEYFTKKRSGTYVHLPSSLFCLRLMQVNWMFRRLICRMSVLKLVFKYLFPLYYAVYNISFFRSFKFWGCGEESQIKVNLIYVFSCFSVFFFSFS